MAAIRNTAADLQWSNDTRTGVAQIGDAVAGLHWCGDDEEHCCWETIVWCGDNRENCYLLHWSGVGESYKFHRIYGWP